MRTARRSGDEMIGFLERLKDVKMKWWNRTQPKPVLFELHRSKDPKEISGTGHVLDGVIFPNGVTVIQWRKKQRQSVAIFSTFKQFESVHMKHHDGTQLHWVEGFDGLGFATRYLGDVARELDKTKNSSKSSEAKEAYGIARTMITRKAGELEKKSLGYTVESRKQALNDLEEIDGESSTSVITQEG